MAHPLPSARRPYVCNAPMFGTATSSLAAAVSKAGGLGFLGAGFDFSTNSPQINALDGELTAVRAKLELDHDPSLTLPVGVGFITCHASAGNFEETALPVLSRHKPAAVWLFAPDPMTEPHPHEWITTKLHAMAKSRSFELAVFVQVGSVAAAREAARHGADVLVAQGSDAGGHQYASNAGIVSLVPEVRDMLDGEFAERKISLLAAGGIVDGRGLAASLALGADGIVMGTRFIVTPESSAKDVARRTILSTFDGGSSTAKSTAHDDVLSIPLWPTLYDGRAIVGDSYRDFLVGVPMEELVEKFQKAAAAGDESRSVVWAGTGVGLIRSQVQAGNIVKEVHEQCSNIFTALQAVKK